jgi:dolichyl-phosphate-mannose--protein O-mannosyl transferase
MNSTYFDEIYHPRTAYEYLHGLRVYEWTHPPFGKWLISLGISAYGMTPFGWRFVGVLFGVFMIPAIYFFAKFLFKKNVLSAAVCTMFTFDFMHYAQSRLATVDTYITFFVILMYMFMFKYITTNYNDKNQEKDFRKNLIWLALSGISMGLGVASKWPGVYAGIGLAVIFFTFVGVRFLEFIGIKNKAPKKMSADERFIKDNFKQMTLKTFAACVVFFVIIPIGIYLASYALVFESYAKYYDGYDYNFIEIVLKNQEAMYNYHSSLESSHPYSAAWWQWPFNMRPMFYYSAETLDKLKQGISSFGNPIVWFCGFFAALYCAFKAVKKKSSTAAFIFVGYIAQYLPWILVSRTTYAYHYFPCVPFLVLALGEAFKDIASIIRHSTSNKAVFGKNFGGFVIPYTPVVVFSIVAVILFFVFLPVLTGTPIPYEYAEKLRWMKGWQLVI